MISSNLPRSDWKTSHQDILKEIVKRAAKIAQRERTAEIHIEKLKELEIVRASSHSDVTRPRMGDSVAAEMSLSGGSGLASYRLLRGDSQCLRIRRSDVVDMLCAQFVGNVNLDPKELYDAFNWPTFGSLITDDAPQEAAKLQCIMNYFRRVFAEPPQGYLYIRRMQNRNVLNHERMREFRTTALTAAIPSSANIESIENALHADFANMYIGGGVLSGGCVQEEIRFAECPECIVALLMCEVMNDNEAIVITGAERFAKTKGYAFGLQYDRDWRDNSPRFADGTIDSTLVAIDAKRFRAEAQLEQLDDGHFFREINKALAGFDIDVIRCPELQNSRNLARVATGNWGCGVFAGDPQVKFLIQWIVCSIVGKEMVYSHFNDRRISALEDVIAAIKKMNLTVFGLYNLITNFRAELDAYHTQIFDYILKNPKPLQ